MVTPRPWFLLAAVALLVLGVVAVPGVRAEEEPAAPEAEARPPTTIPELEKALDRLARRMDALLELAARDPRHRLLDTYEGYSRADFANSRRPVKARDLVEIIDDGDAPEELRLRAAKLLVSENALKRDPDLVAKKGNEEPRKRFGKTKLANLLRHRNEYTRELAHQLLKTLFPDHKNDPLVLKYDAVNGSSTEWRKTANHWKKVLGR